MDQGALESDTIRGYRAFKPVYKKETATSNESYRLIVRVIKGSLESKPATKVTLLKEALVQSDFFSDPKKINTDGLEEKVLLYRIGREIQIERAIAKSQKRQERLRK